MSNSLLAFNFSHNDYLDHAFSSNAINPIAMFIANSFCYLNDIIRFKKKIIIIIMLNISHAHEDMPQIIS